MVKGRAALGAAAPVLALAVLASGCTGSSAPPQRAATSSSTTASSCQQLSRNLVAAVQRYVDAYGTPLSGGGASATAAPDDRQLQAALQSAQQGLQNSGCNLAAFRRTLAAGLQRVSAHGPVAEAVLLRLTASVTGTAKATPSTVTVRPDDNLPRRLAELAPGSQVRLVAGSYRLTASLALLEGVTIVGAGRGRTAVVTSAGDAGMLVLTDGRVELRDLTVRHAGKATGDLLVGGPTSALVLSRARITGAAAAAKSGGNGVLMTSPGGDTAKRGTTLQVTDSTFDHNGAAGILLTGGHVASIRGARFEKDQECGVCFAGSSTGAVRSSTFAGNRVGVAVLDHAKPALVDDTFTGGLVGVQASGNATPVVQHARISRASRAAMIFDDRSAGSVDGSTCSHVPYGIVVAPHALPWLGHNSCLLAHGQ